jgi:acyl-CoA thioester hydrolase
MPEVRMDLTALPVTYEAVIPESYLDEMGHMNVMWYTHLFSCGTEGLFERVGLTRAYFEENQAGTFALEQHTRYLVEVRVGQRVLVRTRLLGRSAKLFHFLHFLVHADGRIAATGESVGAHIDMRTRRTSPFPAAVAMAIDQLLAEHEHLGWTAPVCGVMRV